MGEAWLPALRLVAYGFSNVEIADRLRVPAEVVKDTIREYREKVGEELPCRHVLAFYAQRELSEPEWQRFVAECRERWARLPALLTDETFLQLLETWVGPEYRSYSLTQFAHAYRVGNRSHLSAMIKLRLDVLSGPSTRRRTYARLLVIYRAALYGERDPA